MQNKFNPYRKLFPALDHPNLIYLDNAATMLTLKPAIDSLVKFYTSPHGNVMRGLYAHAEETSRLFENARENIAEFIGAQAHEIIFTSGATAGINTIAQSWAAHNIKPGDEILITQTEHHSNILPWLRLAEEKQLVLKTVNLNSNDEIEKSRISQMITEKTKLFAVALSSNVMGNIWEEANRDLKQVISHAHEHGCKVLIDAAQAAAHEQINVRELGCDFLVFSGHKMGGATGIGVLYISQNIHHEITPGLPGGGSPELVQLGKKQAVSYREVPYSLEAGTPPIAQAIALGEVVNFYREHINFDELERFEKNLITMLEDKISDIPGLHTIGAKSRRSHVLSFYLNDQNIHAHDIAQYLDRYGICVRAGDHCAQPLAQLWGGRATVRVSVAFYNTEQEIIYTADKIREAVSYLRGLNHE